MSQYEDLFRPDSPDSPTFNMSNIDKNLTPIEKVRQYIRWFDNIKSITNWEPILKSCWVLCYDFKDRSRWGENPNISVCMTAIINDLNTIDRDISEENEILYHFMNAMLTQMLYLSLCSIKDKKKIKDDDDFSNIIEKRDKHISAITG